LGKEDTITIKPSAWLIQVTGSKYEVH